MLKSTNAIKKYFSNQIYLNFVQSIKTKKAVAKILSK